MGKCIFDFSKLRGRIIEKFGTYSAFAEVYGKTKTYLSRQLSGKSQFSHDDIVKIVELLEAEPCEIGVLFYTLKVS